MPNLVVKKEPSGGEDKNVTSLSLTLVLPIVPKRMASEEDEENDRKHQEKAKKICLGSSKIMEPQMLLSSIVKEEPLKEKPLKRSLYRLYRQRPQSIPIMLAQELSSSFDSDTSEEMESYRPESSQKKRPRHGQMMMSSNDDTSDDNETNKKTPKPAAAAAKKVAAAKKAKSPPEEESSDEEEEAPKKVIAKKQAKNKAGAEERHKFPKCRLTYKNKSGLNAHINRAHGNGVRKKSVQCEICRKMFGTKAELSRHMATHTGERDYVCTQCEKRFKLQSTLQDHMLRHVEAKNFTCSQCQASFRTPYDLRKHTKLHEKKELKCHFCEKRFHYQAGLKQHQYTHMEVKPHECKICNRRFGESGNLDRHVTSVHSNEKRFVCHIANCGRRFSDQSHKVRHVKGCAARMEKNKCTQCPERFGSKKELTAHVKTHRVETTTTIKLETTTTTIKLENKDI